MNIRQVQKEPKLNFDETAFASGNILWNLSDGSTVYFI